MPCCASLFYSWVCCFQQHNAGEPEFILQQVSEFDVTWLSGPMWAKIVIARDAWTLTLERVSERMICSMLCLGRSWHHILERVLQSLHNSCLSLWRAIAALPNLDKMPERRRSSIALATSSAMRPGKRSKLGSTCIFCKAACRDV